MRRIILLALPLVFATSLVLAQSESIGIFADSGALSCNLPDASGETHYYLVHTTTQGSIGCMFSAPKPTCSTGTFYWDETPFPGTHGSSQSGVSVSYGRCLAGSLHVLTMVFFTRNTTPACCYWSVSGHPGTHGYIVSFDCSGQASFPIGGGGIVKAGAGCDCRVPVEMTTWGRVKSLYVE